MNAIPKNLIRNHLLIVAALAVGCATAPDELVTARATYESAEQTTASQYAPAEMQEAFAALNDAEAAFKKEGANDTSKTLAYVATRKAEKAVVVADTFASTQDKSSKDGELLAQNKEARENLATRLDAKSELAELTNRELQDERQKLTDAEKELEKGELTKEELAAERIRIADLTARLEGERQARLKLEADIARIRAELEKVATIKEEPSKMVITLNGSVLFETNKFDVRAASSHRLDQVAQVLLAERNATITVLGFTDSEGSNANNQTLSENRAMSVRNYLVMKGIAGDRISSKGFGESNPVAPNTTATGRANNRRVEIVVDRDMGSASL